MSPSRTARPIESRLGTEFGEALRTMVRGTPGAVAGVVSDDEGDAIDYAHDPASIDGLDVQLLGAQLGPPLFRLQRTADAHDMTDAVLLFETQTHNLVASPVGSAFVVALLLDRRANLGRALSSFAVGRNTLRALLA